jgi:hypothetical protein
LVFNVFSTLHILGINPLSDEYMVIISSHS